MEIDQDLLSGTAERIVAFRRSLADRPVQPPVDVAAFRAAYDRPLPDEGASPDVAVAELVTMVDPIVTASAGPRYFGFVVGGTLDAALCADLLTTGWDQIAYNGTTSPAAALVEEQVGAWLKDILGIPSAASFGLVTGAQAANTVALSAARLRVLERAGWDVERDGLIGAPAIRVIVGEERHATIDRSLRLLGLGTSAIEVVPARPDGAIDVTRLAAVLDAGVAGPTIVCSQVGNVNTGASDDVGAACAIAHGAGAWVHVDGAFGLWAAASPSLAGQVRGHADADSWTVDGHKWLNVPYDTGFVFTTDPIAHHQAMAYTAAYIEGSDDQTVRAPSDFVPESSRRAREFPVWAALRQLGRSGVADLVDRCCALARRFADQLAELEGVSIANEVVLNQVLVDFGTDERTDAVIAGVQSEGTCWMGGTTWHGRRLMRISVSNWTTTEADVDRSVDAIARVLEGLG